MKKLISLFAAAILLVTINYGQNLTDAQKASIVSEVQAASKKFWIDNNRSYNGESLKESMAYIDENNDRLWQTGPATISLNTTLVKSRADWENIWGQIIDSRSSTNITIPEDYFAVISDACVLEVNKGEFTITEKGGNTIGPMTMVNTILWIKRDGKWKILHCHESYEQ
ncbi:MAG: nuclear transport factor 2 family protein [Bacteroidota bacterium]|nr:nuclear transport factor 2 family protein [Bacteroidota bacterium]